MRVLLSFIAQKIYPKDYQILEIRLSVAYKKIDDSYRSNYCLFTKFLISGEDHRFRYHFGFDFIAILRAIRNRLFYKKMEGASTIEQQLVRVLTNNFQRTFNRKIKEIFLSTTIQNIVPKKDIPYVYLETAYYGNNIWGLSKTLNSMNISSAVSFEKAAEVIACIKYPYNSMNTPKRNLLILKRKAHLLRLYEKHNNSKLLKVYG
jgi:membrane carboxypeptidase/penicillin-binding protein